LSVTRCAYALASTHLWRKVAGELLELFQLLADVDLLFSVQQERDNGLCATRILDGLRREEQGIRRRVVVGAVFRHVASLLARGVLEQKYHAVQGAKRLQVRGLEGGELLELDVLDAELLDEVGEDALR
jgi:hypothetical protein